MDKIFSTITGIVPQITYDIIARFVPGIMVILSWIVVCVGPEEALKKFNDFMTDSSSLIGWSAVLFLLAAYIVSIVLYGIWKLGAALLNCGCAVCGRISNFIPSKTLRTKYWRRSIRCIKGEHTQENRLANDPAESLMYDAIRHESPEVGSRIVKLRAEVRQAQVLIVGWVITIILSRFSHVLDNSVDKDVLGVALTISIFGLFFFKHHLEGKYVVNINNYWDILELDQTDWYKKSSKNRR